MSRCDSCNVPGSAWCHLQSVGRCAWLAAPHWAAHNAARSPLGPAPEPPVPAEVAAAAEAARLRRAQKPRVPLGCGPCHGQPAPPADPSPDPPAPAQ